MKITNLGRNQTEISKKDGTTILISCGEVVAAFTKTGRCICTSRVCTREANKHIRDWLDGVDAVTVSQEKLDKLIGRL